MSSHMLGTKKASKKDNLFKGMSSKRDEERARESAAQPKTVDAAMQAYLKKYAEGGDGGGGNAEYAEPKRKKKKAAAAVHGAIRIVDQDVNFAPTTTAADRKPPTSFSDGEDDDDDARPTVANMEEARALAQQLKRSREYGKEGDGWAAADDGPSARGARATTRHDSLDASPPRRGGGGGGGDGGAAAGAAPMARARMTDGTVAGLLSARELAQEARENAAANKAKRLNAEGRGAQTIYRDRASGKAVTKEEFVDSRKDARAKKREEEEADQHLEWRGGLAQKQAADDLKRRMEEESTKAFARYEHDADFEAGLKGTARFGDPFANLARKKASEAEKVAAITDRYDADALQKSGFNIPQEVPLYSWLKRGVADPGNRYNIKPGRHWDGVNRTNGFERDLFRAQAEHRSREHQAREWAQSDM
ncbi:hypothetical protein FOA52_000099 [Chlamydomonas sp. UWO 241]|nr:hypothetical protein FOA52_000099 [Chlamydomonas sp. UWO 241]